MMTTTEILNEIHRLPTNQQMELKEKLLREKELNGNIKPPITQDEFDRILFDDGFLANLPVETQDKVTPELLREMLAEGIISWIPEGISDEEDNFEPIKIKGKPLSETLLEDRN